jgi:serine protease Do
MNQTESKFLAFLAIIATALAGGAFVLSWQSSNHFFEFSPANDGFVAPRDISTVIDETQESTVQVNCNVGENDGAIGTGWAIDSKLLQVSTTRTAVITNHHVIEECLRGKGFITINKLYKKEKSAEILIYDLKNDLAVLATDVKLKPLELSSNPLWPGYWVMTLGSADGFEGSVSFGSVLNLTYDEVLITNNVSSGNSGGPLIDNEGKVVGIVTWGMDFRDEQYNGAKSLDTFCLKIFKCEFEIKGEKTWFDYLN